MCFFGKGECKKQDGSAKARTELLLDSDGWIAVAGANKTVVLQNKKNSEIASQGRMWMRIRSTGKDSETDWLTD